MAIYLRSSKRNIKRSQYQKGFSKSNSSNSQEFVFDATDDEINDYNLLELNETRTKRSHYKLHSESSNADLATNSRSTKKEETVPYVIQPNDSLQSLSLKFGCPVSKLKRVNHLINDKEFYALRQLKVPAKEHSLLSEVLCSTNSSIEQIQPAKTIHLSISHMLQEEDSKEAKSFLQEMDRDIQRIVEKTKSKQSAVEEQLNLNSPRIQPLLKNKNYSVDGASWGISWCSLLLVIVILGVITPALYGIYIVTFLNKNNSTNAEQTNVTS